MKKQTIVLTVGGSDFKFRPDIIKYNNFLNQSSNSKNKVQAIQNFLIQCCEGDDDKEKLRHLFGNKPGTDHAILEQILNEYQEDVAVVVKKSETEPEE